MLRKLSGFAVGAAGAEVAAAGVSHLILPAEVVGVAGDVVFQLIAIY
jgi:hypothetical protein